MQPRTKYIWRSGVLGWGVVTGTVCSFIMPLVYHKERDYLSELQFWLCMLPLWAAGGYLWGAIMWKVLGKCQDSSRQQGGK